jgi:hypothetical protein
MRKMILALASVAAIGFAAPVVTAAPAEAHGYHKHRHWHGGWHRGHRRVVVVRRHYVTYPAYNYGWRRHHAWYPRHHYGWRRAAWHPGRYGYGHGYGYGWRHRPGFAIGFRF